MFPLEHGDSEVCLPDVQTTFSEEVALCHKEMSTRSKQVMKDGTESHAQ